MSITGSAKPACTRRSPISCMSTKRLTCVCRSAPANAARSSFKVSGPERRERRESADLQHAPELFDRARQVVDPLQRKIAPDEVERCGRERERGDVAAHAGRRRRRSCAADQAGKARQRRAVLAAVLARRGEHRQRKVERHAARLRIARRELALRRAGAAAGIEDDGRRELHDVETLRHARADFALEHRGLGVRSGGPTEGTADGARIQRVPLDGPRMLRQLEVGALSVHPGIRRGLPRTRPGGTGMEHGPRLRSRRGAHSEAPTQATRRRTLV